MSVEKTVTWKDGEVVFCQELVKNKGCAAVPPASVTSYLQLQLDDAVRDGAIDAAQALLKLRIKWTEGRR